MALIARHSCMGAGQRELCLAMVEPRPLPLGRVMAQLAILRKTGRNMIGILCSVEVRQVAGDTVVCRQIIVVVDVTGRAGD